MEHARALVIIDYQNIHLTAHDCFAAAGAPVHETLVHPLHFANQVLQVRHHRSAVAAMSGSGGPVPPVDLVGVAVFRGLPSNRHHPNMYRRNLAQQSEWTRDRRVEVTYRPLKYHYEHGAWRAEEKGIDVLIALKLVRSADRGEYDVVILASHDTDLEPALDEALASGRTAIETAGWRNSKRLRPTGGAQLPHTVLDKVHLARSLDGKDYR